MIVSSIWKKLQLSTSIFFVCEQQVDKGNTDDDADNDDDGEKN